jgi:hypothetical protein
MFPSNDFGLLSQIASNFLRRPDVLAVETVAAKQAVGSSELTTLGTRPRARAFQSH